MHPFDSMTPEEQALFEQESADWTRDMGLDEPPSEADLAEMQQQNQQWQADQIGHQSIAGFVKDCVSLGRSLAPYRDEINRRIQDAIYAAESEYDFNSNADAVYEDAAAHAESILASEGYREGDAVPAYLEQQVPHSPSELRAEGQSLSESAEQIREDSLAKVYAEAYAVDMADRSILQQETRGALGEEYAAFCAQQKQGPAQPMSGLSSIDFGKPNLSAAPGHAPEKAPVEQQQTRSRESSNRGREFSKGVSNGFKKPSQRYIPPNYEEFNNPIDDPDYGFDEGEFA